MDRPPKILVVEDEALVAMGIELLLVEFGYDVVGPASNTRKALSLCANESIDAAVLDVNLGHERVDCVAEALAAASVPFVFSTGYGAATLPPAFKNHPILSKPYRSEQLREAVARMVAPLA